MIEEQPSAVALSHYIDHQGFNHFTGAEIVPYFFRKRGTVRNSVPPVHLWSMIVPTLAVLDVLRGRLGHGIDILSTYRSPAYNQAVGGVPASEHVVFRAIDFTSRHGSPRLWASALRMLRGTAISLPRDAFDDTRDKFVFRGGIGVYETFVHLDTRGVDADWTG